MAMVHAAKMQAEASDAGIQDLIKKAMAIHKQLQDVQNSINAGGPRYSSLVLYSSLTLYSKYQKRRRNRYWNIEKWINFDRKSC